MRENLQILENILRDILFEADLDKPDGRLLCCYRFSEDTQKRLAEEISTPISNRKTSDILGATFVLWATERFRTEFQGGKRSWKFVFDGLQLSSDMKIHQLSDREYVTNLVECGLSWWESTVRRYEGGKKAFLFSLVVEGGLPEALIKENYFHFLRGAVRELETEGGVDRNFDTARRIIIRKIVYLPGPFRCEEIIWLFSELICQLVFWRKEIPSDIPNESFALWLDTNKRGWESSIPLKLTKGSVEAIIRPVLNAEREHRPPPSVQFAQRLIRKDSSGDWCSVIRLADVGSLSTSQLRIDRDLRVNLRPKVTKEFDVERVAYSAVYEEGVWILNRIGSRSSRIIRLPFDASLTMSAFADGKFVSDVEVAPIMLTPDEVPSFWGVISVEDGGNVDELQQISGIAKTRFSSIWMLTSNKVVPEVSDGLKIEANESAEGFELWRLSGEGTLRLPNQDNRVWSVQTGADDDAPKSYIVPTGKVLAGWRHKSNGSPVYIGVPQILGAIGDAQLLDIPKKELKVRDGQGLWTQIFEWHIDNNIYAGLRVIALPAELNLCLREINAGSVALEFSGIPKGLNIKITVGTVTETVASNGEASEIIATVDGIPPGIVSVRISDVDQGKYVQLEAPWPSSRGMILDPEDKQLDKDSIISVDGLSGWRAYFPPNADGHLELRLMDFSPVSIRVSGEIALIAYQPLIRAMLSQGDPDSQVNLRLIVNGKESQRLEIRLYHHHAEITKDGVLHLGLERGSSLDEDCNQDIEENDEHALLCAISLCNSEQEPIECEKTGKIDLHSVRLPEVSSPWLIQTRLGKYPQRAVVWSPRCDVSTTPDERIEKFKKVWNKIVDEPANDDWLAIWKLTQLAEKNGDASVLDQVQALAYVPEAAVSLALRVNKDELVNIFELDTVSSFLWSLIPITGFHRSLKSERAHFLDVFGGGQLADEVLSYQIGAIVSRKPELSGHFGVAMLNEDMSPIVKKPGLEESELLVTGNPGKKLDELVQEAVRRFDRLPQGVVGLDRVYKDWPQKILKFNDYMQPFIDAPLVSAEIAFGLKKKPSADDILKIIHLRMVDTHYYDKALPVAINYLYKRKQEESSE